MVSPRYVTCNQPTTAMALASIQPTNHACMHPCPPKTRDRPLALALDLFEPQGVGRAEHPRAEANYRQPPAPQSKRHMTIQPLWKHPGASVLPHRGSPFASVYALPARSRKPVTS
jgi:hypothetical protein